MGKGWGIFMPVRAYSPSISTWSPDLQTGPFGIYGGFIAAATLLQSCPTLCDPIDGSPLDSYIGIIYMTVGHR